jgi:hypothetical protein
MRDHVIVQAPTNVGLHSGGVEMLSAALIGAGFAERLRAPVLSRVVPPPYDPDLDPATHIMNARAIPNTRAISPIPWVEYSMRGNSRSFSEATAASCSVMSWRSGVEVALGCYLSMDTMTAMNQEPTRPAKQQGWILHSLWA